MAFAARLGIVNRPETFIRPFLLDESLLVCRVDILVHQAVSFTVEAGERFRRAITLKGA
jgi:hypothetical protein